jgi:hypothetical protein
MIGDPLLVGAAVLGPAVAALGWLVLSRWPVARRVAGGVGAAAAHAAAWGVAARLYRGQAPEWRGLAPGLAEATLLVLVEAGIILVLLRAERLRPGQASAAIVAIGVAATAVAYGSYSTSLAVQALALPLPTLAVVAVGLTVEKRGLAGGVGLALADVIGLIGLSAVFDRTGSSLVGQAAGLGPALLVLAGAMKAGVIPGMATWSLTSAGLPGAALGTVLRGQGIALALLAAVRVAGAPEHLTVAALGAAAALVGGLALLGAARSWGAVAALCAAGGGVPLLALGLGGAVGARAFLLAFPAFLLGSSLVVALAPADAPATGSRVGTWAGGLSMAAAAGTLAAIPPLAGFPGSWLALQLATVRAEAAGWWLLLVAPAAIGLGLAAVAAPPLVRASRPRTLVTAAGLAAGGFLVYMGVAPVRLALGWLVRAEGALGLPEILPTAGAPTLPALSGRAFLGGAAVAAVLVLGLAIVGRGLRPAESSFAPTLSLEPWRGRFRAVLEAGRRRAEARFVAPVALSVLEAGALFLLVRLVMLSAQHGFL